eukprot:5180-Heterococcus_DN1.PRE.1
MDAAGRGRPRRPATELPQPPQRVADPAVEKDLRNRLQATPGSAPAARTKPLGWRGPSHGGLTAVSPVQPIVQRPVRRLSTDYFEGSGVVAAAGGVAAAAGGGSQAVAALRRADSATFGDGTQQQQQQQQSVPSALKRRSSKSKDELVPGGGFIRQLRRDPRWRDPFKGSNVYLYLKAAADNPYKLTIVDSVDSANETYYTLSQNGLVYSYSGKTSFTTVEQFEREYKQYYRVRALPFFKQYHAWRAFLEWRASVRSRRWSRCAAALIDDLFILHPVLAAAQQVLVVLAVSVVHYRLRAGSTQSAAAVTLQEDTTAAVVEKQLSSSSRNGNVSQACEVAGVRLQQCVWLYVYILSCGVLLYVLQELAQLCSQLAARRVFKSGLSVLSLDDFSAAQGTTANQIRLRVASASTLHDACVASDTNWTLTACVCVLTKQAVQRAALDAALAVFSTSVRTLLLTACDTVLYQFLQAGTHEVSFTERAAMRSQCRRLARFIRVADLMVADTYLSIALLSTEKLVASMAKPHTAVTDAQLKALQPLREEQPAADCNSNSSSASSSSISSAVQAMKRGAALTSAVAAFTTAAAAKLSLPVFIVQLSYKQGIELLTPAVYSPVVCVDTSAGAVCVLSCTIA